VVVVVVVDIRARLRGAQGEGGRGAGGGANLLISQLRLRTSHLMSHLRGADSGEAGQAEERMERLFL
jgi:hypothetical protein